MTGSRALEGAAIGHLLGLQATSFSPQQMNRSMPWHCRKISPNTRQVEATLSFWPIGKDIPKARSPRGTSASTVPPWTLRQSRQKACLSPCTDAICQPSCWLCLIQESNYITFKSPNLVLFLLCTSPRQSQSISPSLLLGSKLQPGCRICSRTGEAKLFPAAAIARGLLCQSGNITGGGRKGPGYLAVARKLK